MAGIEAMNHHHNRPTASLIIFFVGAVARLLCRSAIVGLACLFPMTGLSVPSLAANAAKRIRTTVELCTDQDIQTIELSADDRPLSAERSVHRVCAWCFAPPANHDKLTASVGNLAPIIPTSRIDAVFSVVTSDVYRIRYFLKGSESRAPPFGV